MTQIAKTKVEQQRLLDAALAAVQVDGDGQIIGGYDAAWRVFAAAHGLENRRARRIVAKAARLHRGELPPTLGRPTIQGAPTTPVTVTLTAAEIAVARAAGDGNASAGLRRALRRLPHGTGVWALPPVGAIGLYDRAESEGMTPREEEAA